MHPDLRVIIVCDWIPPAFGAVGQYMIVRAEKCAAAGRDVVLIGLGDKASVEARRVGAGSLTLVRLAATKVEKSAGVARRALWAFGQTWKLARKTAQERRGQRSEIIVTGSPPFLAYLLIVANMLLWRDTLVYRITDFYPETLLAAGHLRGLRVVQPLFHWLRRRATRIEAIGHDQKRRLLESGFPEDRIVLARDGSPIVDWSTGQACPRPFPENKTILLYSGNLGVAHEVETFCQAYREHVMNGPNQVRLWVNGSGARVEYLRTYCIEHNLPVHFSGPSALENLPGVLLAADAHLVLLGAGFWGYVLPSKVYSCIEKQQPLLYVGPVESDVHLLASARAGPYFHSRNGDVAGCVASLEALAACVGGAGALATRNLAELGAASLS